MFTCPLCGRPEPDTRSGMTRFQQQIFRLMAQGHKDQVIADKLGVCRRTVIRHVNDYAKRRGLTTRFQIALDLRKSWRVDHID